MIATSPLTDRPSAALARVSRLRRCAGVLLLATTYWAAIALWGQALNRLNGIAAAQDLLAGQVLGAWGGGAITSASYLAIRSAGATTVTARLIVGGAAALAGSAAYALLMIGLSHLVPVAHPLGAAGIARFAWEVLFFLPPFSLSTAFVLVIEYGRLVRERDRTLSEAVLSAREAEVRALHYQINPHFLYNALNSLSTLIIEGRGLEADQMVHRLAGFFRGALTVDPLVDVALAEELDKQRMYLSLEEIRYADRLNVRFDIPRELDAALVPSLILQPLIENAIRHGVHEPGGVTTIAIAARAGYEGLVLTVRDNGPSQHSSATQGTGIGLENVRRRLGARFGDHATLRAGRDASGGFTATITMPLNWPDGIDHPAPIAELASAPESGLNQTSASGNVTIASFRPCGHLHDRPPQDCL